MLKHKTAILLLVLGVVIAGVTTAWAAYCEQWGTPLGQIGSGSITWNSKIYYHDASGGYAWCKENDCAGSDWDGFLPDYIDGWARLVTSDDRDTLYLIDSTYSTHGCGGCKQTGRSGTKDGLGTWCGYDTVNQVFFWGDWDATFDYTTTPDSVDGNWDCDGASSGTATGSGTGEGALMNYIANCNY